MGRVHPIFYRRPHSTGTGTGSWQLAATHHIAHTQSLENSNSSSRHSTVCMEGVGESKDSFERERDYSIK